MKIVARGIATGLSVWFVALGGMALAGTPLTVQIDQSQLLSLDAEPGTIIVGNPSIADVSVNGRQMFVHGHSFGETNLMIFDVNGKKMGDYELTVGNSSNNQVTVFIGSGTNGPTRYTYSCAPTCEAAMMVGDPSAYLNKVVGDNRAKSDYASGVKSSDLAPKSSGGGLPQ